MITQYRGDARKRPSVWFKIVKMANVTVREFYLRKAMEPAPRAAESGLRRFSVKVCKIGLARLCPGWPAGLRGERAALLGWRALSELRSRRGAHGVEPTAWSRPSPRAVPVLVSLAARGACFGHVSLLVQSLLPSLLCDPSTPGRPVWVGGWALLWGSYCWGSAEPSWVRAQGRAAPHGLCTPGRALSAAPGGAAEGPGAGSGRDAGSVTLKQGQATAGANPATLT